MKKIIMFLVGICQVLVVLCISFTYNERDLSDIQGYFGLENEKQSVVFEITSEIEQYHKQDFVEDMLAYAKEHNCLIIRTESYGDNEFIWNMYSPFDVFQLMNLSQISAKDIQYDNSILYDTDNGNLSLFNKEIRLIIRPFHEIEQNFQTLSGHYEIFFDEDKQKEAFFESLMSDYANAFQELPSFERDEFIVSDYLKDNLIPMAVITLLLLGLLIIMLVNQNLKTIGILKCMGLSGIRIGRLLYQKLFIEMTAVSLAILIISYIWIIGIYTRQAYEAIELLAMFYTLFLIGILLVFLFSVLLILRCPVYAFIKNKNFSRRFMNLNYVYAIVALLLLMPMCTRAEAGIRTILPSWTALITQQNNLNSYIYAQVYQDGYRFDGYDLDEISEDYYSGKPIRNKMYGVYKEDYEFLNEAGSIYFKKGVLPDGDTLQSYAEVNMNYLKKYPLRKQDGSELEVKSNTKIIYILVPDSKKDIDISYLETYGNPIEKIILQDEQRDALDLSLLDQNLDSTEPLIYVAYGNQAFRLDKRITNHVYLPVEKKNLLASTYKGDHLQVINGKDQMNARIKVLTSELIRQGIIYVPALMLILLVMVEYTHLYILSFRQRLFVRRVQGTKFMRVYLRLFMELAAPFVFVTVFFYKQQESLVTLIFMTISLLSSSLLICKWDHKILSSNREVSDS